MKAFGLLCLLLVFSLAYAEYDELCVRFANGVQFREPGNCLAYVTCTNGTGAVTTCPNDQLYDKDNKKCVATLSDTYCNDQCKSKSDVWVADRTNCDGYYFCRSGEAIMGACPSGYHFDQGSQMCIFPEDSTCYGLSDFCGILPNSVPFSDPDNCDKYFQCTKGALKQTSCSSGLYFDVSSGSCLSKYEVSCGAHPVPSNICGKDSKPTYNEFVNDGASCRGYFYCAYKGPKISDKDPAWSQCAEGWFFDVDNQSCNDPTEVRCAHNRCEGRGNLLVISEIWGCRYYHVCQNGIVAETRQCPRDMFFDENRQACIYDETSYPACDY